MGKKINAFLDINTNRIVIVSDNVENGDYIELNSLSSISDYIENFIENDNSLKDKFYNQFKNEEEYLKLLDKNKQNSEKAYKLENEVSLLNEKLNNEKINIINEYKSSDEFKKLENERNQLLFDKQKLEEKIKYAVNKYKSSDEFINLKDELNRTKLNLENLKNQIPLIKKDAVNEYKSSDEFKKIEIDLNDYKQKVELRNKLNIKQIGEDLENYCLKLYNDTMGQYIEDSIFKKTTKPIDNNMPDFIFEVYGKDENNNIQLNNNDYLLGKVILEMKSELSNSENKKKNSDHLEKLEKNRKTFNADIAILVSELEQENDFIIQKPINYKNIIIIRPQALTAILNILRNLYLKQNESKIEAINFKSSIEIIEEFNNFKNSILDNSIRKIEDNIKSIYKNVDAIKSQAEKIYNSAKVILDSHVETIINKINNFKIENKVIKKINKIENNFDINYNNVVVTNTSVLEDCNIIKEKIKK